MKKITLSSLSWSRPNKVKTISSFLDKSYIVRASVGHITKIRDSGLYNMGIDTTTFKPDFVIDDGKKDVVKELKELVKKADTVYLASDLDREGEAISWHLSEQLNIPAKKLKRITFPEITKSAVLDGIAHPRKIDMDLVDAAIGRAVIDKIIGYRLSPISRRSIGAKSVGRCQSVALKLVTDREKEILNFDSKKYFEIWLPFTKDKKELKAQYKGLLRDKKNSPTIEDEQLATDIVEDCKDAKYKVKSIDCKDREVSPKPPFTTSTFQQEVSSKLGYSVKKAQQCAQTLFEGINVGGQHVGLITYIRTDSTDVAPEFDDALKTYIKEEYGDKYYAGGRKTKKQKNAQEAHECIRPTDLSMTPERLSHYVYDEQLIKVYTIIYNRTVASRMSNAIITDTDFTITEGKYKFIMTEHAVKYDGFRKVYALDDEEIQQGTDLCVGEQIKNKKLELMSKETQPPRRYSESTLIKKLEDIGCGRPSTYASIIGILLDKNRNYCQEQGKAIAPTELGMKLSDYLEQAFPTIINYDYTAQMEESLDQIAKGKLKQFDFLNSFYDNLESAIKHSRQVVTTSTSQEKEYVEDHVCPNCGKKLLYRQGKFGKFIACSGWRPYHKGCDYTEKIVEDR